MIVAIADGRLWLLLTALTVVVAGFAGMNPSLNSLISRRSDPARQGSVLGVSQSVSALARILGPMLGIPLLKHGISLPYWTAFGLMILGLLLVIAAARGGRDYGRRPTHSSRVPNFRARRGWSTVHASARRRNAPLAPKCERGAGG